MADRKHHAAGGFSGSCFPRTLAPAFPASVSLLSASSHSSLGQETPEGPAPPPPPNHRPLFQGGKSAFQPQVLALPCPARPQEPLNRPLPLPGSLLSSLPSQPSSTSPWKCQATLESHPWLPDGPHPSLGPLAREPYPGCTYRVESIQLELVN